MGVQKTRVVSIIISVGIVLFLIILGPVQAFLLNISAINTIAFIGDKIFFNVSASTGSDETQNIDFFTLNITGPKNLSCSFLPNGTLVTACPLLDIELLENLSFNFGYGYGYAAPNSLLKYKIKLTTNLFSEGNYTSKLFAITDTIIFESTHTSFKLLRRSSGNEIAKIDGCSLRAKEGSSIFNNTNLDSNNRLNVFIPSKGAKNGKGFYTSQEERNRISYSFEVLNATKIGNTLITFETSGTLRFSQRGILAENATIKYFTQKELVEIKGKTFSAKNLEVTFVICN